MNVIELLFLVSFIVAGYVCGKWLGSQYGLIGWVIGFLLGCTLAIFAYYLLRILIHFSDKKGPPSPCKNEKCLANDYKVVEHKQEGVVFRCGCGTNYLHKGNYFMEILDNGSLEPYMKYSFLCGWKPDKRNKVKNTTRDKNISGGNKAVR